MGAIGIVLSMLAAVVASGIIVRAIPLAIPLPLVQIAFGAVIAAGAYQRVELNPEVFFLLFLPPLLFLDGWRIPKEGLLRDKGMILELALGLVIVTVLGMGLFIHWLIPAVPYPVAFALAAIVSPTDPVAVSAISARFPIPKRVLHVLEGESLLNDASGLVCFRFAVAAALSGMFSLWSAAVTFVQLVIVGIIAGVVLTLGIMMFKNWITRRFGEETGAQVVISLLIPFGAYELAEHLGGSGILAAVAAGITMSYVELSGRALAGTRVQRTAVWDTVQFALNGIMFVLLGEQLPAIFEGAVEAVRDSNHENPWWLAVYVLAINLGLAVLRFLWVWVSLYISYRLAVRKGDKERSPPGIRLVAAMSVAGVRGAITLAGVLTLPLTLMDGSEFPARDLTILLAAGVIILSLTAASFLLPFLLRGLHSPTESVHDDETDLARAEAAKAAIRAVEAAGHELAAGHSDADLCADVASQVMDQYRRRLEGHAAGEDSARIRFAETIERKLRLVGLSAERETIFALARRNEISDDKSRALVREIDLLEERLAKAGARH
ncbi:MAG TPA: Na+/H+ antiporter [Steroidobacter sp.]|uniref:Na+/H+ antiporter n=1 Tax=Steroidobacter sp. TaxID=1978227 RepID=UPI002ED903A7